MKKLFITLLCVLLSIVTLLGLVGCSDKPRSANAPSDPTSNDTSNTPNEDGTPNTNNSEDDQATNEGNNDSSSKPTFPPFSTGTAANYNFSETGTIRSSTGTNLNLYINWSASSKNGKTMTVKFTVGIESYSIQVGARENLGKFKINGETLSFSTSPLTIADNRKKVNTDFYTFEEEYSFEKGETLTFDVIASWVFNGVYGGTDLGTLVAGDTVTVKTPK